MTPLLPAIPSTWTCCPTRILLKRSRVAPRSRYVNPATHLGTHVCSLFAQTTSRKKRKIVAADSDDDLPPSDPIPYKKANGRSKKPRMSAVFSDVEEDEETAEMNSFAKRLAKYQKSPSKSKSKGQQFVPVCLTHSRTLWQRDVSSDRHEESQPLPMLIGSFILYTLER